MKRPESKALFFLWLWAMPWLALSACEEATRPRAVWLSTGTAPGQVVVPRAVDHDIRTGQTVVIDRAGRVQVLNEMGQSTAVWKMPEYAQGKPVGVTFGPDGNIYIPDTHYHRVLIYSTAGQLLGSFGSVGTGEGEFIFPTDVAFDATGNIYVSEYGDNDRVQVFSPEHRFIRQFGSPGFGEGEFSRPQSLVIYQGELFVADSCNHRISVFSLDGKLLRTLGRAGGGAEKGGVGEFRFPYGLAVTSDGVLLVSEFGNNRVQMIERETGKSVGVIGSGGTTPGRFHSPWAVAAMGGGKMVVADTGNNRLQVFDTKVNSREATSSLNPTYALP